MSVRRVWFYFRIGYGTYLGLGVAMAQFLIIAYTLFIDRLPGLEFVRARYLVGLFLAIFAGLCIIVGWLHTKHQLTVDSSIAVNQNPYNYMVVPGKEKQIQVPLQIFTLETNKMLMEKLGLLSPKLREEYDRWLTKLNALADGGQVT